jgi:hypothetical protein
MRAKWTDFLFTLFVRFVVGVILGILASLLVCVPAGHGGKHALLAWVMGDAGHPHRFWYWILAWSIGGGIIAMLTIPYWQTPWYKYERLKFDEPKENVGPSPCSPE